MGVITVPKPTEYDIDGDQYGKKYDPKVPEHQTVEIVNGYLTLMMVSYARKNRTGADLWETFREDCEEFTLETFETAHRFALRELREFLVANGVWVDRPAGSSYARRLYACYKEDFPAEWTEERQAEAKEIREKRNANRQTLAAPEPIPREEAAPREQQARSRQSSPIPRQWDSRIQYQDQPQQARFQQASQVLQPQEAPQQQWDTQTERLPATVTQPTAKPLLEMAKLYATATETKFGGEKYDILEHRLKIFYDCCDRLGIRRGDYKAAFPVMLKGRALEYYYDNLAGKEWDFDRMVFLTRCHFESNESRQQYLSEWRNTTLQGTINDNPSIPKLECLEKLIEKLRKIQRCLGMGHQDDLQLRDQIMNSCRSIPECALATFQPADTTEAFCAQLRSAIGTAAVVREAQQFHTRRENSPFPRDDDFHDSHRSYDHNWTDRTYNGKRGGNKGAYREGKRTETSTWKKKCYVCGRVGCWSNKHTDEERQEAYAKFRKSAVRKGKSNEAYFQAFLTYYEGDEDSDDDTDNILDIVQVEGQEPEFEHYLTEFGSIEGISTVAALNDQSAFHALTKIDPFEEVNDGRVREIFSFENRYSGHVFQGIMPDTGASGVSTAGEDQVRALQRMDGSVILDETTAGEHTIRFGKGTAVSSGTIEVNTPIGRISFCVVPTSTPFLLCIEDMDRLGVRFDNLRNMLIKGEKHVPVVRKWGHPWLLLNQERSIAWSHLTETELRQLHRRFGHPSVRRLARILQRAGHDFEDKAIRHLTKICHQCQMHQKSPGRFKFTLKDDYDFNFSVVTDILHLDNRPVLQAVDSATSFQAARFVKDMSAKSAWEALRMCWIDTYLGPPDQLVHDAGKNFSSTEFRQYTRTMAIEVKEVPVEAHNSVGKVERYHVPLRRAYEILKAELGNTDDDVLLQMAVKAVNDSAGPDGLVPTLLVFGAYPRMSDESPPAASVSQRAEAVRKAMKEIRRISAKRQVSDALGMRNGPNTAEILQLPIQSEVRVWREKKGWRGPFTLLATDGQTCTVQMPYGAAQFRSTIVKPYYRDDAEGNPDDGTSRDEGGEEEEEEGRASDADFIPEKEAPQRRRGRPPGSKNKPKTAPQGGIDEPFVPAIDDGNEASMAFITAKEESDLALARQLRAEGKITTPGRPFEASRRQEVEGLMARGVFQFEQRNAEYDGVRIFKSRMVNEVKGKATDSPYEKSRLVIQGYNDEGKEVILTQSPTIQRASQRLIIALAPTLLRIGMMMHLRDITQAYTQSATQLNRVILAHMPEELRDEHPRGTIMRIMKPLYGIAEAGTHWWATYSRHHKEKLSMVTSTFDPCLLITSETTAADNKPPFGIVGMQTDDTLHLGDDAFDKLEEEELRKAEFTAKDKQRLTADIPLMFNGCILSLENDACNVRQKDQGKKISVIDAEADRQQTKQRYIEQRARGAYIASICQPEASFDLSIAAQQQEPTKEDIATLNKRLQWQIDNLDRGLNYVPLDISTAKLFVFVDGSFANNKDYSSQLGYEVILANETQGDEDGTFVLNGNMIHWSSTKSKRVTRSVLASEIYGMVGGVDMAIAIGTTLAMITTRLGMPDIPLIVCTDSYSLYECLVKLGTTKEKRLMIDIMALRQSYERRELFEIRWINGQDNPADAMTKALPNQALTTFVDTNRLQVRVDGWVKR